MSGEDIKKKKNDQTIRSSRGVRIEQDMMQMNSYSSHDSSSLLGRALYGLLYFFQPTFSGMYIVGGSSSEGAPYSIGSIVRVVHAAGIVAMAESLLELTQRTHLSYAKKKQLPYINVL